MTNNIVDGRSVVMSYITLRKFIGILGFALPGTLFLGGVILFHTGLQPSMSAYYHTGMGDVFVGTMCAIGVFLLSYRGLESRDDTVGNLACLFAVGLALFPTAREGATGREAIIGKVHFIFAAAFFLMLSYFALRLFTKTDPNLVPTPQKLARNRVYRTCGYVMLGCILAIAVLKLTPGTDTWVRNYRVVFWFEAAAVVAFGISWLIKGEAIMGDKSE